MAGRIKGIAIELAGETKKLGAALGEVEKRSRDLQDELKQVERLLKLDPRNTELVAQKQKLLREAVEASRQRLQALKTAQGEVNAQFERGDIGAAEYRRFQRDVIAAERQVKSFEAQLTSANSRLQAVAGSVQKFGSSAEALGKKLGPVSAAAAAALTGMVGLAVKAGATADDLNTLAKQTGLATDELQKYKYASDLIDVSLDTVTGSLTRLTRSMADAKKGNEELQGVFDELDVKYRDTEGNLRDNEAVFYDLLDALARVDNETERDAKTMKLFGKSAQDLNPLILGGAEQLRALGQEAEELGLVLSQDALDGMNEFNDKLDKTKAQLNSTVTQLGGTIGEALLPTIQSIAGGLQGLLTWFRGLSPETARLITTVLAVVASLAPLLIIIGKVAGSISSIIALATKLGPLLTLLKGGFLAMGGPVLGIVAGFAAAIAAGVLLYKNWDKIVAGAKALISKVKAIGADIVKGLWSGITGMGKWLGDKVSGFFGGLLGGVKKLLGIRSPSTVFEDTVGRNMALGIGAGFSDQMRTVTRDMQQSLQASVPAAQVAVSGGGAPGATVSRIEIGGTIRVEGVNDEGQTVAVAEYAIEQRLMDKLQAELRRQQRGAYAR